ncbi:MAG: hypothetical protein KAJ14_02290 [Candidatus Omnitrophica bacterium]|nr:hypothetical protein [Candidatus Omnitrophota bacterium]
MSGELEDGMVNDIVSFPKSLNKALEEISSEYKIKLLKETHFNAINRVLKVYKKNIVHRLDFNLDEENYLISVTYYIDTFPIYFSRLLERLHDIIPLFPYCAKIKWSNLEEFSSKLSTEQYKEKIKSYIEIIQKDSNKS